MELVKFKMSDIVVSINKGNFKVWRIFECLENDKYNCVRFVKGKRKTKVFDVGELRKVKRNRYKNAGDMVIRKSDLKVLKFLYPYNKENVVCEVIDSEEYQEVYVGFGDFL